MVSGYPLTTPNRLVRERAAPAADHLPDRHDRVSALNVEAMRGEHPIQLNLQI